MNLFTSPLRFVSALAMVALFLGLAIPAQAQDEDPLVAAVAKLESLGVITDSAYWLENARRTRTCDGAKVGELIIAAARRQGGKVDTLEAALNHLAGRRVLAKTDYWQANAVEGKTCTGRQVASLISRLARTTR